MGIFLETESKYVRDSKICNLFLNNPNDKVNSEQGQSKYEAPRFGTVNFILGRKVRNEEESIIFTFIISYGCILSCMW